MSARPVELTLIGVDFTSAPRRAKPITAAIGRLDGKAVELTRIETLSDWPAFEALLVRPGPWLGAFDFPFGLPREAIVDLGWPLNWPELVRHCEALGKSAFRSALDAYRQTRPFGQRYAHRSTDLPAPVGPTTIMRPTSPTWVESRNGVEPAVFAISSGGPSR